MPELPEVQTTVNGLRNRIVGLRIKEAWSGYDSPYFKGSETIKDKEYFKFFRKEIVGRKIVSVERRAKNILINLNGGKTILVHMKMTGHLLYGRYRFVSTDKRDPWEPLEPESLKDPYNRRVRFIITFDNGSNLALSDTRKFAKVTLIDSESVDQSLHLNKLGPEPLEKSFTIDMFRECLDKKPRGKIKQVLTDQTVISGIGNIYADESLWLAGIHPLQKVKDISEIKLVSLFKAIKKILSESIRLGGDSMSDYRNIYGNKGNFQEHHHAYQKTGQKCEKKGCKGKIVRIVVDGRATHYCPSHQQIK